MPIRPEGLKLIIATFILGLTIFVLTKNIILIFPFLVLLLLVLNFFRDPERYPDSTDPNDIISPADGKVIIVDQAKQDDLGIDKIFKRVAIFMSPLDVHVNRAPCSGKVVELIQKSGGFERAFLEKSEKNARLIWHIVNQKEEDFLIVQIAGAIARRIKSFKEKGDEIKRGERIGMIYLGSRVDLYIPQNYEITVKVGDKVYAGKTIVASKK